MGMTSFLMTPSIRGPANCGSNCHSDGVCVKNTFVHLEDAPVFQHVRSRSCEARFLSEFEPTYDGPLDAGVCTVMVKNIPCRCTQDEFLDCVHELGFKDKYGTFHMPGRSSRQNFGYAFMKFNSTEDASRFYEKMSGIRIGGRNSSKRIVVVPADVQSVTGTKKLLKRYGMSVQSDLG